MEPGTVVVCVKRSGWESTDWPESINIICPIVDQHYTVRSIYSGADTLYLEEIVNYGIFGFEIEPSFEFECFRKLEDILNELEIEIKEALEQQIPQTY